MIALRNQGFVRSALHVFLGIIAFILITGGGRLFKIDFLSIDPWAAAALLLSLVLFFSGLPILSPRITRIRDQVAERPIGLIAVLFGVIFITHLLRFLTLHVNVLDAGYLYQSIFQAFSSPILKCDICYGGTYLGAHSAFTLAGLTPFANLLGTPFGIPLIQAALGFCSFVVLYYSFRSELPKKVVSFAFFLLLSVRGLREGFLFDFREDLLGAFFYILAFGCVKSRRPLVALFPFLLAALSKETAAILLPVAMLSSLYVGEKPRAKLVALYALFGVAVFAVILFGIFPRWTPSSGSGSDLALRLAFLGGSLKAIFLHLATFDRLAYFFIIAAPVTYFAIRAFNSYYLAGYLLLAGNLISDAGPQRMMQFHYEILLLPFFGFGLLESLRSFRNSKKNYSELSTLALLLALSLSGTWPMTHLREYLRDHDRIADVLWARTQLSSIPEDAEVMGDSITYPLLTDRKNLSLRGTPRAGESPLYAVLITGINDPAFSDRWTQRECGPRRILCLYVRK